MYRFSTIFLVLLKLYLLIIAMQVAIISSNPVEISITATPAEVFSREDYFPDGLACSFAEQGVGPRVGEIQIGRSTFDEFKDVYNKYDVETTILSTDLLYVVMKKDGFIPFASRMCVVDNIILAVEGYLPPIEPQSVESVVEVTPDILSASLTIYDYVDSHGKPDVITFTLSPAHRVAFWFEEGIALVIWVGKDEDETVLGEFGTINRFIFFPYQDVEDYELRWPYNRTYPSWIYTSDKRISSQRDPFNFSEADRDVTPQVSITITPVSLTSEPTPNVTASP